MLLSSPQSPICYLYSIYFNKITVHCFPWYCHRIRVVAGILFPSVNSLAVCICSYVLGEQFSGLNLSLYSLFFSNKKNLSVWLFSFISFGCGGCYCCSCYFFSAHFFLASVIFLKLHFIYTCFYFVVWPRLVSAHTHTCTHWTRLWFDFGVEQKSNFEKKQRNSNWTFFLLNFSRHGLLSGFDFL